MGAFRLASVALRAAQESKALVKANIDFKLNIKNLGGHNDDENNELNATGTDEYGETSVEASGTMGSDHNIDTNMQIETTSSSEHSHREGIRSQINNWFHLNLGD